MAGLSSSKGRNRHIYEQTKLLSYLPDGREATPCMRYMTLAISDKMAFVFGGPDFFLPDLPFCEGWDSDI